jgi:hypothetical protein
MTRLFQDPERDPRLAESLRRLDPAPVAADEAALVRRIMAAAQPALGELRHPARPWWEWLAGWSRLAVPAGVAVSLAAGGVLLTERGSIRSWWSEDSVTVSETVLSAATLPAGEVRVSDQLLAAPSDELLLNGAYQSETEASPESR